MANDLYEDATQPLRCRMRTRLKPILIVFKLKTEHRNNERGEREEKKYARSPKWESCTTRDLCKRIAHAEAKQIILFRKHYVFHGCFNRQHTFFLLYAFFSFVPAKFNTIIRNKRFTCQTTFFHRHLFAYINQRSDAILTISLARQFQLKPIIYCSTANAHQFEYEIISWRCDSHLHHPTPIFLWRKTDVSFASNTYTSKLSYFCAFIGTKMCDLKSRNEIKLKNSWMFYKCQMQTG